MLAAESGLYAAREHLALATSNHPNFLVGITNVLSIPESAPILVVGSHGLRKKEELIPLVSGNLTLLKDESILENNRFDSYLQPLFSADKSQYVDLNENYHFLAAHGKYLAPWVFLKDQHGHPIARYAYVMLDEEARLHPLFHRGEPRDDPINWDHGSASLSSSLLLNKLEEEKVEHLSTSFLSLEGWRALFENRAAYDEKKEFLTTVSTSLPDLIPEGLPEAGRFKYDLNDLATNRLYGQTPSDRALHLAMLIDHSFPHFKERDPSLRNLGAAEERRYLNRLAACIVNYISPEAEPILVNGGEPAGAALTPLVTQTAERCRLLEQTSNSITIENQYFLQLWNPYTTMIPAGGRATLEIKNRQILHAGQTTLGAFKDYVEEASTLLPLRPNESIVLRFPSVIQVWNSSQPILPSEHPYWLSGPEGNAHPSEHQSFHFYWNDHLVMMSRSPPVGPGSALGGLEHDAQSLEDHFNFWQCNFIPTQEDHTGHFRFVGDPRENYLSNYLWKSYSSEKSYLNETCWKGAMQVASEERLFDPYKSWKERDFVPLNPTPGNKPLSRSMTPDEVISPYEPWRDSKTAPLFLRHGPMNSIVELGNINDPAQADDLGAAPAAGSSENRASIYASGGGRTLRVGQPEFPYWDTPGKRAIDLIDLFTVATTNNRSAAIARDEQTSASSSLWRQGLINVNTASTQVLTSLFYQITPTSDQRFTNSSISLTTAQELAAYLQKQRPYEKLSDLSIMTPLLANATTYTPSLSTNVLIGGKPLAAVFDRAREEGFGKFISLCTLQSRAFRVYILGETLNAQGERSATALLEASILLLPNQEEKKPPFSESSLIPKIAKKQWLQ